MPPLGLTLSVAFVLGVVLFGSGEATAVLLLLVGVTGFVGLVRNDPRWISLAVLVALAFIAGLARNAVVDPVETAPAGLSSSRQFTGTVVSVPRRYPTVTYAEIEISEPGQAVAWAELPVYPRVRQGDVLAVQGTFQSSGTTRVRGLAAQRGVQGVLRAETVAVRDSVASTSQRFRNRATDEVRQRIETRIPEPAGAFTVGMLIGDDGAMTESTRHNFRVGGMTHMTAVSGLHVGILAAVVLMLSRAGLVHRWVLLATSLPLIWTYAYVVGMRPSVVRASLMFTLLVLAALLGRPRDTLNAVGIATAAMILFDPAIRFDIGFQLSVAATIGIAVGVMLIANRSIWHTIWVVPLAAEIAVEPLILYHFGYYSLVSPAANIIAAPFFAIAMALGILTVTTSVFNEFLADVVGTATWVFSSAVVTIADLAARIPGMSGDIEPLGITGVLVVYAVLIGIVGVLFVVVDPAFGDRDGDVGALYRV